MAAFYFWLPKHPNIVKFEISTAHKKNFNVVYMKTFNIHIAYWGFLKKPKHVAINYIAK